MCKPRSTVILNLFCWSALTLVAMSLPVSGQEKIEDQKVFSGPQPGEKLPPLKARIIIGQNAGKEVDILSAADGKPVFLIFMNAFGELVNETMRVMTLYAERQEKGDFVTAVVWVTSDPSELEAKLKRAKPHMPKKTPVGISLAGPEGPGAYGLNRRVQMTVLVAKDNVVTANFALVQPSIQADSVAVLSELVKVIGGQPPTLAEVITPRNRQIVATRIELMLNKSASDDRVRQLAAVMERFVRSRRDAKIKLGQMSKEIVEGGQFDDRAPAIGYLRKWTKEYEEDADR